MVFSSLIFLFLFLPIVLGIYYVSPRKWKNLILFAASLVFYAWGEPIYIFLMLLSTVTDYFFGLLLSKPQMTGKQRKWVVACSLFVNIAVLAFFKYADFLIININSLLGTVIPLTDLPLPIGISFYTFQSMSYILDIYRGTAKAQKNWIDFATFVSLFPQLVAGPIVHYGTIAEQLRQRVESVPMFAEGIRRFIIGLAKKVLLANNIGVVWDTVNSSDPANLTMAMAWLGIIAFAFQIYFDFSGYSDMAIGLGLMFGFRFNENFDRPYISRSITEFWRRWHISLGTWFRNYLYIPLGGNRFGKWIQMRNILIVWMLTGIWHGANWNFMFWGLYFGLLLMFEKWIGLRILDKLPKWIQHSYALLLILVGWVLFSFEQPSEITHYLMTMFAMNQPSLWDTEFIYLLYTNLVLFAILIVASVGSVGSVSVIRRRYPKLMGLGYKLQDVGYMLLFLMSIAYLVDATYNPFLYFRF